MFRLIYRQRRRIFVNALLVSLSALSLFYFPVLETPNDIPSKAIRPFPLLLATSLTLGILFSICSIPFIWLFPNYRFTLETLTLLLFTFAVFGILWPDVQYELPVFGTFLIPIVAFIASMTLHGSVLDRFRISRGLSYTSSFKSVRSAEMLWKALVPSAEFSATHWDSLLHKVEPNEDDPKVQIATYYYGASLFESQKQTIVEDRFPHFFSYRFEGNFNEKNQISGNYSISLEPQNDQTTRVTLSLSFNSLAPSAVIGAWLDDRHADTLDAIRAKEMGKRDWSIAGIPRRKVEKLS